MADAPAASTNSVEPFVDDELISITMSACGIEFHFGKDVLQIGRSFTLAAAKYSEEAFEPARKQGNVQKLWPLIGQRVMKTEWGTKWGDEVELLFDNGTVIKILPVVLGFRGTILGKFPEPGTLSIEDF